MHHRSIFKNSLVRDHLIYEHQGQNTLSYRILNLQGKTLRQGRMEPGKGRFRVGDLQKGIYFVNYWNAGGQQGSHRFVKQ